MKKFKLMFTAVAVFAIVGTAFAFGTRTTDNVCKAPVGVNGCPVTCSAGAPEDDVKVTASASGTQCYSIVASTVTQCSTQSCATRGTVSLDED